MELPDEPVIQKLGEMIDLIDEEDEGPSEKFKQLLADVPDNEVRIFSEHGQYNTYLADQSSCQVGLYPATKCSF